MRTRIVALLLLHLNTPVSHFSGSSRDDCRNAITAGIPAPAEVLGFNPGDDRKLASWNQVLSISKHLTPAVIA